MEATRNDLDSVLGQPRPKDGALEPGAELWDGAPILHLLFSILACRLEAVLTTDDVVVCGGCTEQVTSSGIKLSSSLLQQKKENLF